MRRSSHHGSTGRRLSRTRVSFRLPIPPSRIPPLSAAFQQRTSDVRRHETSSSFSPSHHSPCRYRRLPPMPPPIPPNPPPIEPLPPMNPPCVPEAPPACPFQRGLPASSRRTRERPESSNRIFWATTYSFMS